MAAILAIGVVVGFVMGWISFRGPSGSGLGSAPLYDEDLVTSIYEKASPAVVEILVSRAGPFGDGTESGSGFLVDEDGHFVTNFHVVEGAEDIAVRLSDGRSLVAAKLGESPADDLAVLRVDLDELAGVAPLPLADSSKVVPGEMAVAIGSPFTQRNSVSVGVVSGVGRSRRSNLRRPIPDMVQTDAALNPGNSGGPLLNRDGEVIGVNSSVQLQASVQIGIGFAISSNTLKGILPDLLTPGEFRRPWIGISSQPMTSGFFASLGLGAESGIYVLVVCDNGPAAAAGIRGEFIDEACADGGGRGRRVNNQGDVITAVDGMAVSSVAEMVSYFNGLRPGDEVTVTVFREGSTQDVKVTLAAWMGG